MGRHQVVVVLPGRPVNRREAVALLRDALEQPAWDEIIDRGDPFKLFGPLFEP